VHGREGQISAQQQKWIDRACRPPKMRGYHGKALSRAGDIAMPVKIESGAIMKTTAKYPSCWSALYA
jgi:hypothetical protein